MFFYPQAINDRTYPENEPFTLGSMKHRHLLNDGHLQITSALYLATFGHTLNLVSISQH